MEYKKYIEMVECLNNSIINNTKTEYHLLKEVKNLVRIGGTMPQTEEVIKTINHLLAVKVLLKG